MRLEKLAEDHTATTYTIELALIESTEQQIVGSIRAEYATNLQGRFCSRVVLYMLDYKIRDTFPQEGIRLYDLITKTLQEEGIELEDSNV